MMTGAVSSYEAWQEFAASWGLAYFGLIFIAALVYALWPSRRAYFDEAGKIPLREDRYNVRGQSARQQNSH